MNNQKTALKDIENFLKSDKKCMLVTGTHQFKKHVLVMYALHMHYKNAKILFRVNSFVHIDNPSFLGKFINKVPKSGEILKIENNYYSFDSFRPDTWWRSDKKYDFAILYPIDSILKGNIDIECITNLLSDKQIKKVFLISCTDHVNDDYKKFNQYIDEKTIYDAEEEDIHYHRRVLGLEN